MAEITPEAKKTDNITNDLVEIVQPSIEKMIYVIRDSRSCWIVILPFFIRLRQGH